MFARRCESSAKKIGLLVVLLSLVGGVGCVGSYNKLVQLSQAVDAPVGQVQNAYQRRADLIPNLVETVKGAAEVRARHLDRRDRGAGQGRTGPAQPASKGRQRSGGDAAKFQQAQDELSSALSRLLVVSEHYPDLKATANFRDLQVQLEGTENRIAVERMRFNEAAQAFNTKRDSFPTVLVAKLFGHRFAEKAYFKAQAGAATAPKVQF